MHFSAFPYRASLIRSADTARHTQRAPCTHEQRRRPAGPEAVREKAIATTAPGIPSGRRARGSLRATRERTRARALTRRAAMALADARDVWRAYTFEAGALQWRDGERRRRTRAVPRHAAARGPVLRRLRRSHRARDLRERRDRRCERRVDIGDRHTPIDADAPRWLRLRAIDPPSPSPRPTAHGRARRPSYSQPLWMNSTTEYRRRSSACCRTASTIRDTPSA